MTAVPDWLIPPVDGFTADDLDRLPDLPPHTELLDGSLIFVSPQKYFHSVAMFLFEVGLRATAPDDVRVVREMAITLGMRDRPEPDLSVVRASAVTAERDETGYQVADVVLAVEVVSPDSVIRDREVKPRKYAEAGIPHFWRVEKGDKGRPVVYVYERDPATKSYGLTGIYHDELKTDFPYPIAIDLTAIDRL
ncbi:Uma2 family endonuclease [Kitasatospora sp. NBC_01250]|uniref:Uma2 family endonuclease n=1 Tax=unclassified Kitasatospora TaxID=2633591 RepID=UPI002E144C4C|nr:MULTISPECIES: Uma2 family endonuclease [unclassified Kitasatospora]WSJ69738.1 Uma2 family endonuclease [Kitasatospora sp. NBC_01302]